VCAVGTSEAFYTRARLSNIREPSRAAQTRIGCRFHRDINHARQNSDHSNCPCETGVFARTAAEAIERYRGKTLSWI
ncbi:MAG: hypothetical protein WBQ31_15035, partial [Candidatus Acidiferrales bacterium]